MLTGVMQLLVALALTGSTEPPLQAASGPSTPAPVVATPSAAVPAKRICRSVVPTGSVMPKRVCLSAADWRTFNGAAQGDAENAMRRRGSGMCDVGAGSCLGRLSN